MVENNTPPENKKRGRPAKNAPASTPAAPAYSKKTDTVAKNEVTTTNYDAQSYGIFKMRLTNQSSQIKKMTDYSEDSAIK
jgi:hypothetical protein